MLFRSEEIAELSSHQIYRIDGLLKDGLYYSLIPSKWLRGDWYFELAAVKNKNIRQAKCAGFEDIDVLEVNDGAGVFADCTLLEEADLSQTGITVIESRLFLNCTSLKMKLKLYFLLSAHRDGRTKHWILLASISQSSSSPSA